MKSRATNGTKLALLLQAIRVSNLTAARVHLHAPGGVRIPQGRLPHFFIVLEGSVMLSCAQLAVFEPMIEGDFVLLPRSRSHALASSESARLTDTNYFAAGAGVTRELSSKEPVDVRVGSGVRK